MNGGDASFEVDALGEMLDAPHAEFLRGLRATLAGPEFARPEAPLPDADYRERVLGWCRALARRGYGGLYFPARHGGSDQPAQFLAAAELFAQHDGSLMVKVGVQFGLWGGSVFQLGTDYHHRKYLSDTMSLALPGCFAMTEIGHGSNVRDLETTATYDAAARAFILHTPHRDAAKAYIGNAAAHGRIATVFAQLEVGGTRRGVHPFVVPIRDATGRPLPGIRIEDQGAKLGLNGVDNGLIRFEQVRVPREEMLDRFAQVAPDGTYTSAIADPGARFFAMLGTLVGGRISIALAALGAMKAGLAVAVRYATHRRQFSATGRPETLLLDYPSHQARLIPRLARAYALQFALRALGQRYAGAPSGGNAREVETQAAGLKAWATACNVETLQAAREACGGAGYLAVNRFAGLKADGDIYTTFEGDNTVLLQLVAKNLLGQLREEMKARGAAPRVAREELVRWLAWRSPWARGRRAEDAVRSAGWQGALLASRARLALLDLARAVQAERARGRSGYDAFIACQAAALVAGEAAVERDLFASFVAAVEACPGPAERVVLERLRTVFGLDLIVRRLGWFATRGFVGAGQARTVERSLGTLFVELRPAAVALVEAWRIPDAVLGAPIAFTDEESSAGHPPATNFTALAASRQKTGHTFPVGPG